MKRQAPGTEALVYAYGCGEPISGREWTEREAERMAALWDRLVAKMFSREAVGDGRSV